MMLRLELTVSVCFILREINIDGNVWIHVDIHVNIP